MSCCGKNSAQAFDVGCVKAEAEAVPCVDVYACAEVVVIYRLRSARSKRL